MAIVKDLGMVTAYAYAVAGGYEGTEAEFTELLGQAGVTLEQLENLSAIAVTLAPGSEATASYSDGVLTFGIPQGDKGDKGDTGNGITSIAKTGTSGLVDTYTITYTNGNTMTFTVTNGAQGNPGPTGNGISSIAKTGTSGLVDTYTITFTDGTTTTFTVTNGEDGTVTPEQMAAAIAGALVSFATGKHDNMTAGLAEQLLSDVQTTDKKPYLFRRTGADATREFDTLVGGSVVANQLANPIASVAPVGGIEFTESAGFWSITGTATGRVQTSNIFDRFNTITGHKYYIYLSKSIAPFALRENNGSINSAQTSIIANCPEGKNSYFTFDSSIDITGTVVNITDVAICIYDLTQMFGSAIADHAYTLEQATAGSGIAWLKSYGFFAGYQAYNAGSMVHVSGVSAHVMKDADDNIIGNYPLDNTLTLRGIPKLSNGEIYYDGDTYASDGTVTRYYGIRAYQAGDESLTDAITDGTNTVYKLTTPTTEAATPYQSPQICDPDGTEQYVTDGIPVGHETQYPANLKGEIERVMVQVPKPPTANGTYTLKCTVSGGVTSYAWTT